ncbi:acyl-CoA synthetase [Streptosporangium carneum]|uniref:Acyl-CoA synthetase n=2 Tax=Streptosporangium carneum TaxID=47481 RepID=A0A9W6MH99_9ACTN|nr:acyl-CoA synthetase [Streptosporangium carneum]
MSDLLNASDVVSLMRGHVLAAGGKPSVIMVADPGKEDGAQSLSYAELDERAREIAVWLLRRQEPGGRVLLLYPTGLNFVAAFFGCLYAGMVAVTAPMPGGYRHNRRRVAAIAADCGASTVLTDRAHLPEVREWAEHQNLTGLVLRTTDEGGLGDADEWRTPELGRDTIALLQYTSGSTDTPKGVMVTHGNLLRNVESYGAVYGFDESTRSGAWIPLYHDMGLMGQLLPPLFFGGACVLMASTLFVKRPYLWLRLIDDYDVHWSAAPNFAYERCVQQVTDEELARLDLSRWRFAHNGSEPVNAATLRAFAERFAPAGLREETLIPCYGLAEATLFVSGGVSGAQAQRVDPDLLERHRFVPVLPDAPGREIAGCGPVHDFDVRIVDPDSGRVLSEGEVGEIWLRGESVAAGYWHNEEATRATFGAVTADGEGGFLRTGDRGVLHRGELYVTGRIKETIIMYGRNLYPHDIEQELRAQHPELGSVGAVFTVPVPTTDGAGVEEMLVVTHEIDKRPEPEVMRRIARDMKQTVSREFGVGVAEVALLRRGGVQRTTSGKIQRLAMRRLFLDAELGALYQDENPRLRAALSRTAAEASR